jgi:hypothetical protein
MKKITMLITLIGSLFAIKPHLGDSIDFYVNRFMLILYRDTELKKGVVRYVGDNFTVVSLREKININDIARRNFATIAYPDSFAYLIATGDSDYIFTSRLRPAGYFWEQQTQGIKRAGLSEIYKILTNPNPPQTAGNWGVFYLATNKGIYSQKQTIPPTTNFSKIAFIGNPVYSIVYHPDSTGPITSSGGIEILYAGTQTGVYKLRVTKEIVQDTNATATPIPIGTLNKVINAVAIDPVDKSIYAGGEEGLWHWTGTNWEQIPGIEKVNEIKFLNNILFVLTKNGLWYYDGSWKNALEGKNLYDIEYAFNYYWIASFGEGVFRATSPSSWEQINNGLETFKNYGSFNCKAIYFDSYKNRLILGNEQGIWWFENDKWVNQSRGIKKFVADYEIEQIKNVVETTQVFSKIKNVLKVKDEELWDMNADSVVHIILYPLEVSTDSTIKIAKPLYGYFDEYDLTQGNSYASLKEIFVLNSNYDTSILYKNYITGELKEKILAKYLGYLFAEYANWSIEHNESKAVRCGFSMLALHLAGFNIFNGLKNIGITPGREFGKSTRRIATPVFEYTKNWLRAPVSRELDRERMAYLFLYLREKLISYFSNDTSKADSFLFKVMMRDKERDEKTLFEYYLTKINSSFPEFIESWFLSNLLDQYPELGYYYNTADSIFDYSNLGSFSREITGTNYQDILPPLTARYVRKLGASDTLRYNFDFKDGFGDANYGFRVYRIDLDNKIIEKIKFDTLKEYLKDTLFLKRAKNTFSHKLPPGNYFYAVLNTYGTDGYFSYSHDAIPPKVYKKYIIQNPVFTNSLDFYLICNKNDMVYGDAKAGIYPFVILRPFNFTLPQTSFDFEVLETGDSVAIYTGSALLSSNIEGDILVYSYGQDLVGNKVQIYYDTISVKKIQSGGIYVFFNNKVILEVGENSGFYGTVIATKLPSNYLDELPSLCAYSIGNSNMIFLNPVKISFYLPYKEASIYKFENGNIIEYKTYREGDYLYTYTNSLGIFLLSDGKPIILPKKFEVKMVSGIIPSGNSAKFKLSIPFKGNLKYSIYDVIGRKIEEISITYEKPGNYEVNIPLKNKGIYFIDFDAKEFSKKFKLIVY